MKEPLIQFAAAKAPPLAESDFIGWKIEGQPEDWLLVVGYWLIVIAGFCRSGFAVMNTGPDWSWVCGFPHNSQ